MTSPDYSLQGGFGGIHCDLVVGSIAMLNSQVKVLDVEIQERENELRAKFTTIIFEWRNAGPVGNLQCTSRCMILWKFTSATGKLAKISLQ